ncbi:MAG: sodium:proline symporter, partial [Oscillospiraceae bacterium]
MTQNVICILITIILYLVMMVVVGLKFSKKNKDVNDFYLGGRKLGPIVTAMSAEASDMSSYLLMGLPGLAYLTGLADVGWTVIGLAVGTYLNWLLVAKRLRIYSHKIGAITIP